MKQINNRLKKIIFNKLYKDLSHVEIIHYNDSIWFIDRENKYWYLEFKNSGNLWWRYGFFIEFFTLFSMERSEFEPIISEWVEEVLNSKVVSTGNFVPKSQFWVEEVLNSKVVSTLGHRHLKTTEVEEVLNSKVVSTPKTSSPRGAEVEEVLNSKVVSTRIGDMKQLLRVEEVLNSKVVSTRIGKKPIELKRWKRY